MVCERNLKVIFSRKPRVLPAICLSWNQSSSSPGIKNSMDVFEGEWDIYTGKWSFFNLSFGGNAYQPCRIF